MKTLTLNNPKQRGAVLVVSLILLVGVTLVSLSSLHTGLLEIVMSGNEEARTTAFQRAQSGVESLIADDSNFTVVGSVGDTDCTATMSGETCNQTNLSFPSEFDVNQHWAKIERLNPEFACPPRMFATSCDIFQVAHFSTDSRFTDVATRGGRSEIVQGFMVMVPTPGEETVIKDSIVVP